MADDKKKTGAAAPNVNLADLAPEGFEGQVADAVRTGLLTPLYIPRFAVQHAFPMILGWLDRVHIMPTQSRSAGRKGDVDEWTPLNLLVRDLKKPTKGIRRQEMGELTEKDIVDVEAGGKILIPITGQLTVNQDLQDALLDVQNVYWVVAKCEGFKKVNTLNPMADWNITFLRDAKKAKIKKVRDGEFTLADWYKDSMLKGDFFASMVEGELVGSLGEGIRTKGGERADAKTGELLPAGGAAAQAAS